MFLYISECQNYASLNSADRKITYTRSSYYCDNGIGPGWFRFEGSPVQECQLHVHQSKGVTLIQPAG